MGLRSPQQLEQVQVGVPNLPTVEAGKTSAIDLATPAKNFMEQKAIGDQIDSVNKIVINRKDALAKIKSKYAVESVTSDYKSRIAALVGSNAVTQSKGLFEQATRAIEDLQGKSPADLAEQVGRDSKIKLQELHTLMTDKINVEGRKDAVNTGNATVKTFTMDAASKFEDEDGFKGSYKETYKYARYTEAMKGGSEDVQLFNAAGIASNAVFEGVKFSLSQAATPDKVASLQKYYNEKIANEASGIHVTTEDRTKINTAFTAAVEKTEDDLGYLLASKAKELGLDIRAAEDYIFKNAKGSYKVNTQANALFMRQNTADKEEIEKTDREIFGQVQKLAQTNPAAAELKTKMMSPKEQTKARDYLNKMEGGGAKAFTEPKHRVALSKLAQSDKLAYSKENLDKYYLSRDDRRYHEAAQKVIGMEIQDKNYAIDNDSMLAGVYGEAIRVGKAKLGLKVSIDPKLSSQLELNGRDIFYEVRAANPKATRGVIMGLVRDRMNDPEKGLLKGIYKPNAIGGLLNKVGFDTAGNSWFNSDKVEARPSDEFESQDQTGGKDKIRVPEPNADEIRKFQSDAKDKGKDITTPQAREMMLKLRRSKEQATQAKLKAP